MNSEIERKFLVSKPPRGLDRFPKESVRQGYLAIGADGSEVRLRSKGSKRYLTFKGPGRMERKEGEIELSEEQFARLWPATRSRRVEKTRYRIPAQDQTVELDIFKGTLRGLMLAEVEFASSLESQAFEPLPWFDQEVTDDKGYKNQSLAQHGVPSRGQMT